jgi:hypothetical protein
MAMAPATGALGPRTRGQTRATVIEMSSNCHIGGGAPDICHNNSAGTSRQMNTKKLTQASFFGEL